MSQSNRKLGKLFFPGLLTLFLGLALASGRTKPGQGFALPGSALPAVQSALGEQVAVREVAGLSEAFIAISESVTPAVVRIQAERPGSATGAAPVPPEFRDFFGLPPNSRPGVPQLAGGTGLIVSADGHILTNNHVVDGADRITVTLNDRRTYEAQVVGRDRTTDVAVVKIEATHLPAARLGDSDQTRVGEWVVAIGNPGFGDASTLDFTVTGGIISAKNRPLQIIPQELQAHGDAATAVYAIEDFLQTDAVINPGNSGGPLVNLRGEVIGVNTAIASGSGYYQGYGFAIPINLARRVMNDLLQYGHVRRALLGISITDVTPEDAEVYRLPAIAGVLIEDFAENSPARSTGLQRGDVIIAVEGEPVQRVGQLQRLIAQHRPGDSVEVDVIRYGSAHSYRIQLAQAPLPPAPARPSVSTTTPAAADLGIELAELSPNLAREIGYARPGGVVVTGVAPASPAARKQLPRGFRLISIDRRDINTVREARDLLRRARPGAVVSLQLEGPDGRVRIVNVRVPS
jgi:serine protease Do